MENHIMSEDLCNRCIYDFDRHCSEKMQGSCDGCVMDATGTTVGCKCLTINTNTPCPYFVEAENNAVE